MNIPDRAAGKNDVLDRHVGGVADIEVVRAGIGIAAIKDCLQPGIVGPVSVNPALPPWLNCPLMTTLRTIGYVPWST